MRKISSIVRSNDDLPRAIQWLMKMIEPALLNGAIEITLCEPSKTLAMERKYHCLIKDITVLSPKYDIEHWKALLVKWLDHEMEEAGTPLKSPGKMVWDPKFKEYFYMRPSTTDFRVGEASQFIEFLYAYGSRNGV